MKPVYKAQAAQFPGDDALIRAIEEDINCYLQGTQGRYFHKFVYRLFRPGIEKAVVGALEKLSRLLAHKKKPHCLLRVGLFRFEDLGQRQKDISLNPQPASQKTIFC
jgi:hypothetical protein